MVAAARRTADRTLCTFLGMVVAVPFLVAVPCCIPWAGLVQVFVVLPQASSAGRDLSHAGGIITALRGCVGGGIEGYTEGYVEVLVGGCSVSSSQGASSYQSITSGSRLSRDLVRSFDQVYLDIVSIMTRTLATLMVCACIVTFVTATLEDGLPRPANFADEPTTSYGPDPLLTDSGTSVSCDWYGFSNTLYADAITSACQNILRKALTNATANPASQLKPYVYYTLLRLIDPATNESYCYQGCFKLDFATPPVSAPPPSYVRGPALAPMLEPVMAPTYFDGPAMAPLGESPGN